MHEWHTDTNTNPFSLINHFLGYTYQTDYSGTEEVKRVVISNCTFTNVDEARTYVTNKSYYDLSSAYLTTIIPKKASKAFQNAYLGFVAKYNDYVNFDKNLTISYGRKSSKVTCPECGSSIALKYARYFKSCPVCESKKIISDSNWKILENKRKMCEKASDAVSKIAEKDGIIFICGIEWHC